MTPVGGNGRAQFGAGTWHKPAAIATATFDWVGAAGSRVAPGEAWPAVLGNYVNCSTYPDLLAASSIISRWKHRKAVCIGACARARTTDSRFWERMWACAFPSGPGIFSIGSLCATAFAASRENLFGS